MQYVDFTTLLASIIRFLVIEFEKFDFTCFEVLIFDSLYHSGDLTHDTETF